PPLLDLESEKWLNAINVEMQSMKGNKVWVLVELPPSGKTVGSKWFFNKKTDMDRNIHIYKARLVVKGYTQTPWIDYEETFSSVADIRAIIILIAIAAYYEYEIWQMDVKTAFLNGYLNEEVDMEQLEGFVNPKYPNRICKLKRSIYGLKQASRQWNKRFDDEIKKFGFTQNRDEPCVYQKAHGSDITFLIFKWLFKKKTDMDGAVHTYKVYLVAKGYTQTLEIDYEETFSLVADIRAIRILIAIAAYYDYEIWQMDVKTSFFNGYLNEEVYMEQPEGFVNPKYPNWVCKLKHSIYGLKQASRQ
nr:retrotransposon protein, putative, Ty1-copia subclass [Tanacetum cinerariifolium]